MTALDVSLFLLFLVVVAGVSIAASRGERTRADYFLAGRGLSWWLIGFSLIASNISTEHFVGMTGNAARSGLAVASYEWLAAPALVFVAWWLLPLFLRAGIYTIPEYLEYRYDRATRSILASLMVLFFVLTVLATVLYSGATFLCSVLDLPHILSERFGLEEATADLVAFQIGVFGIGIGAGVYTVLGGLKAVVWSDLLQGSALLIGGAMVTVLGFLALGDGSGLSAGYARFVETNGEKLHVVRPWNDPEVPSLTLVTGLWIPVMFYWGLNQFIMQRTLAAGSLSEGQKGLLFAAAIKLLLPWIVVVPGMLAVNILGERLDPSQYDQAYPILLRELLPAGLLGLMMAAITGSVMSTFNSGLNSAATIVSLDLWSIYVDRNLSEEGAVRVGRVTTVILAVAACLWAPMIRSFDGVFVYIQEFWGFVSAPTCAVFFAGLLFPRVPAFSARAALLVGPLLYLVSRAPSWAWSAEEAEALGGPVRALHAYASLPFLHHMFILFVVLVAGMLLCGRLFPLSAARPLPNRPAVELKSMPRLRLFGIGIILLTLGHYILFW